jgi:hypothetical protein
MNKPVIDMTNRPNLTEEEKEHYNKVAMDLIYKDTDLELSVSVLTKTLEKVQLERDALWIKSQEDERVINDLRDAVDEKQRQRDEAIRLATLFQALYLRYGKAEDESYSTLLVKKGFESLANLKGLRYFGEEEA